MRQSGTILSDARHNEGIESEEINAAAYSEAEADDQMLLAKSGEEIPEIESIQTIEVEPQEVKKQESARPVNKLVQLWMSMKQKIETRRNEQKRDKFIASFFDTDTLER